MDSDIMGRIKAAAISGERHDAIELIYDEVDALLRAGDFGQVDALLREVEPEAWSATHLLAFVSITRAAKHLLAERESLLDRVRKHRPPLALKLLLAGLE